MKVDLESLQVVGPGIELGELVSGQVEVSPVLEGLSLARSSDDFTINIHFQIVTEASDGTVDITLPGYSGAFVG